jgi:hypothetical protein
MLVLAQIARSGDVASLWEGFYSSLTLKVKEDEAERWTPLNVDVLTLMTSDGGYDLVVL